MADERQLQQQIDSISGLRNVINSMRSLAATYLNRAEHRLDGVRAYNQTVGQSIADTLAGHDIRPPPAQGKTVVMGLFSEQGLCGRFNEVLAERAREIDQELNQPAFLAIGRRGAPLLRRHELAVAGSLPSVSSPDDIDLVVHRTARWLTEQQEQGHFAQFYLLHARHLSAGEIGPRLERILPLDLQRWRQNAPAPTSPPRLGLPRLDLLNRLVQEQAFITIIRALIESIAAENGMRLKSMEGAKSNIDDTLQDLRQKSRIARQNAITDELLDLVSGTEALRESST